MNAPSAHPAHPAAPRLHPHPHPSQPLTRDDLRSGSMREVYLRSEMADLVWSDVRLHASLATTLQAGGHGAKTRTASPLSDHIWIFAYGSLIWNPLFPVAEQRIARIYGYHRSFCLWSRVGRGTRENPGLVLGLDDGGTCAGLVLRIDAAHARDELALLWRREMVTGAYAPTWVRARTPAGAVNAIAFVIDQRSHAYAGRLPEAAIASNIRAAAGLIGPCSEYLQKTAAGLATHGIDDTRVTRLARLCGGAA